MKNLAQFLEHLKDEVLSPLSEIEIFSFADSGDFKIRLLARRGDVTVLPHHKARIHFVEFRGTGRKDAVRCIGKKCPLCELVYSNFDQNRMMAPATKYFFYALKRGKVAVFSAPASFFDAVYGGPGKPSEVTSLALKGISVFDPEDGRELNVKRENSSGQTFWLVQPDAKPSPLSVVEKEDLMSAPRLSESYFHLNQDEMNLLCRFIEGRTKDLPSILRVKTKKSS